MNTTRRRLALILPCAAFALAGCQTAGQHLAAVQGATTGQTLTAGAVQREIRIGMTSADVIQILGAPNIVTTDDQRREVWAYDRIATDHAYSSSSGGISALVLGFGSRGGGLGGAGVNSASGASSTSQRTITVIIKFDANSRVRDFAYHQSKF
jgi:outer membrane protein assembly factor BamE (lipoprotein component of BamABCDE complex)